MRAAIRLLTEITRTQGELLDELFDDRTVEELKTSIWKEGDHGIQDEPGEWNHKH